MDAEQFIKDVAVQEEKKLDKKKEEKKSDNKTEKNKD
jgi:hypothetical protein